MKKSLLFLSCLSFSVITLWGQRLSNYDRRHMNDKLLEAVISYENYSSFGEPHMQYSFVDLFAKADAKVFCDYIAAGDFGKMISASSYASYSVDSIHVKFVEVRNLRKSDYQWSEGAYRTTVEFDKCLEYEDEIYTYFATNDETIGGDYHIAMDCVFNNEEDKFFITAIRGSLNENCTFPKRKFVVIERMNDRDELLKVNGKPIRFNAFNEAYSEGAVAPVFADEDIITKATVVGSTSRYSKVNYTYKETRLRLRASASIAPISAYQVTSSTDFTSTKSSSYEASVDFGYALPFGGKSKLAMYAGLGVSFSQLDMEMSGISYNYELSDASSVTYSRRYDLKGVKEGLTFTDFMIPVYVSLESSISPKVAITVDAGIKLYLNANTTVNPYTVDGTVSSVYGGTVKNTSNLPTEIKQYMIPASYMRNTYDIAAFGRLGVEYKVKDRRFIFFKVGYLYGITESFKSNLYDWYKPSEGVYPFVYSSKTDSDIAVRSFADCISYRRSALTFDLGFRMKF